MSGRFFLDTNIFVYSFDHRNQDKSDQATHLIRRAIATHKGVVSYQVVQEFFNVMFRRFAKPMTVGDAEHYLAAIFQPLLAVHSSQALYARAFQLFEKSKLSWYDALIVASALEAECEALYSEDLQHGRKFGQLQIRNPFL
jgi:predicted nucleic acid-binding protein